MQINVQVNGKHITVIYTLPTDTMEGVIAKAREAVSLELNRTCQVETRFVFKPGKSVNFKTVKPIPA